MGRPRTAIKAGDRYNRLLCLDPEHDCRKDFVWRGRFRCDCGNEVIRSNHSVVTGRTHSCGCVRSDNATKMFTTHGLSHNKAEFRTWLSIRSRCTNPKNQDYDDYGGSGIMLDPAWESFEAFYNDMGPKPAGRFSIDRLDNAKGYCKDNCRWADDITQANNRTNNVRLTLDGVTKTMTEWAREQGIKSGTASMRWRRTGDLLYAVGLRPERKRGAK